MARRRVKSGAGKPKASPKEVSRRDARIIAPVTHEDLGLDEEETWHKDQDRILLENDRVEEDSEGEEEVFALKGMPVDDEDEDEDDYEDIDEEDEEEELPVPPSKKAAKSKSTPKSAAAVPAESESESESEEEGWGTKRSAYYTAPGDEVDSEDEEARALETAEAKRLQRKAREALEEDDFGLGDVEDEVDEVDVIMEETPAAMEKQELPQDKEGLIRHLEMRSPETLALAREWGDIAYRICEIKKLIEGQPGDTEPELLGIMQAHYQVLLTYGTTLAFYLHLRATPSHARSAAPLSAHPVLERLLQLKQFLHVMESYNFAADDPLRTGEMGSDEEEEEGMESLWAVQKRLGLEDGELEALIREAQGQGDEDGDDLELGPPPKVNGKPKVKAAAQTNGKEKKPMKGKKKKGVTFDLVQPEFVPSARKRSAAAMDADADAEDLAYGEPTTLSAADAADKTARKRSLRFHTSRIESGAARRDAARRSREGGDEDIPYKARRKEQEAQAKARSEARLKTQKQEGADLDEEEWGESDKKRAREVMSGGGEEEDYEGLYEAVERDRKRRKVDKKEVYEAERAAERYVPTEDDGDGPRSLTRAILTNRGLTPKRSKLARNPRVKKRVKFEQAKKKLASQKAVYKGGQAALGGDYTGEKSGISKRLVKSVKL
ncbi:hypothetical protein CALCODRAFT_481014 [Calocera cornea HHB12733]|uniref:Sas10 C-terminal domain-containing protein n=1 Tax=Calocera cornea HHB12733 TaxID=1353952 RepID=A0A165I4X0_9BASI|nr:hypothetical protein CALCODRAFT_481014 [Calocera cornea HHB12733]